MDVKDFVDMITDEEEIPKSVIAERTGINEKTLYTLLSRDNGMGMTVRKFVELAESLGYQILLSNGETGDEYLFDGESDEY